MKIISEQLQYLRISKDFEIELDDGKVININKSILEDEVGSSFESDWDFVSKEDKKIYDSLSEERQDDLKDFIEDIEVIKLEGKII